jgi:hypothetical protein
MEKASKLTGCTERVTRGELPHSSEELGKSTEEKCHADNDIWNGDVARMHVEKGEDERRRRKREQPSRVD